MNATTYRLALSLYTETIEEAVTNLVADGWVVLRAYAESDSIAVLSRDTDCIGIGDANGPWAVELGDTVLGAC